MCIKYQCNAEFAAVSICVDYIYAYGFIEVLTSLSVFQSSFGSMMQYSSSLRNTAVN